MDPRRSERAHGANGANEGAERVSERSEWSEGVREREKVHNRRAPIARKIFRAKGPKIVASYAPKPCRSFVFGPKPYAQHPFDFELAPSTTISGSSLEATA